MFVEAPTVNILIGDVRARILEIPDKSIQTIVTSVPYWGMRNYAFCSCTLRVREHQPFNINGPSGRGFNDPDAIGKPDPNCLDCNGTGQVPGVAEKQIGREASVREWVEELVAVGRELRRVLRDDGSFWLNCGDRHNSDNGFTRADDRFRRRGRAGGSGDSVQSEELEEKNILGLPWRLAFGLQDDGWILRTEVIWDKPNVMPGSARDRPTRNHEYIFLLTKKPRIYYDSEAVKEPISQKTLTVHTMPTKGLGTESAGAKLNSWMKKSKRTRQPVLTGRALRTVWTIAARAYGDHHYATFPEEIPARCIKAGTSERGACATCMAPWKRITKKEWANPRRRRQTTQGEWTGVGKAGRPGGVNTGEFPTGVKVLTLGWAPTCECNGRLVKRKVRTIEVPDWSDPQFSEAAGIHTTQRKVANPEPREVERNELVYESDLPLEKHPVVPCLVLDPFAGSGTTGAVARNLGRSAVLIELNGQYAKQAKKRASTHTKALELAVV